MFLLAVACALHTIADWDEKMSLLELEDGSLWEITQTQPSIHWCAGDAVTITHSPLCCKGSHYMVSTNTIPSPIAADLVAPPLSFGPLSHWIVDIDYVSYHIFLDNATLWCVHPHDHSMVKHWLPSDHVIIGQASQPLSYYPYILINADMEEHVRVMQY